MVFFTCSGAVTLNVQCSLLHLYNSQCLPIRSDIITHSYCCSTDSLVVLAEKRRFYQKPQVPSWLPISLQLWSLEVWSWEAWPVITSPAGEPFCCPALYPRAHCLHGNVTLEEPCSFWKSSCLCSSWALLYFLPRHILQSWGARERKEGLFPFS